MDDERQLSFSMSPIGPLYVLFLLDDSSAIKDEQFSTMSTICDLMCTELTSPHSYFGAIAFHGSSVSIADFTPDRTVLIAKINAHKRKRGNQNINIGLACALRMFVPVLEKKNARRICCIFTNGSASWIPLQKAKLQKMQIATYCIGIGATIDKLQKDFIYDCTVKSSEVDKIINLINSPVANDIIHRLQVEVATTLTKSPIKFQESMSMTITVNNIGTNPIPAGTYVAFFGGEYFKNTTYAFVNDIEHGRNFSFQITMQTTGKPFSLISDTITFKFFHPVVGQNIHCNSKEITLRSEDFIGSYINFKPSNPSVESLNILLFGIMGCGKSSFLNAILSAFSPKINDPCTVGGTGEHVTLAYRRFEMGRLIDTLPDLPVNLWDTWGLAPDNYTGELLAKLLEGDVPSGFSMSDVRSDGTIADIDDNLSPAERRIHGVLLFVPIRILDDETLVQRVKDVLREINKKNHQTIIIATFADLVAPDLLWFHRHSITMSFNLPDYKVHLATNYRESREKIFSIDKVTLDIFAQIVQIADTYAKAYIDRPRKNREYFGQHVMTSLPVNFKGKNREYEIPVQQNMRTSVLVNYRGKNLNFNVNETTTFESLLATVAQKAKIDPSEYCLASQEEGGIEYALKDYVRAALSERETTLYVCKNESFD